MTETSSNSPNFLQSVLGWLHSVYPDGIPRTDYYPLLALLKRTLSEDEVVQAAFSVLKGSDPDDPVTADQIREAIPAGRFDDLRDHVLGRYYSTRAQ